MNRLQIYYLICDILSSEKNRDKRIKIINGLKTSNLNWSVFISTGSNHLVLQTIYCKIISQDLTPYFPTDVLEHLRYIYSLNYQRNIEILEQVKSINKLLARNNIVPMYLKGVGNLIDGLYQDVGERIMYDIDFLVPNHQWIEATEILLQNGYVPNKKFEPSKCNTMKHYPTLSKVGARASVEVHRLAVDFEFSETFNVDTIWQNKKLIKCQYNCFVMSDSHKILHNFIHSQLHHEGNLYAKVFIRNIYDLFLLSKRENPQLVFLNMNKYHKQAANYLRILQKGFCMNLTFKNVLKYAGNIYLFRYDINLRTRLFSRLTYFSLKIFRAYVKLPFKAVFDSELRISLIKRLLNRDWYFRHFRSYKQNRI